MRKPAQVLLVSVVTAALLGACAPTTPTATAPVTSAAPRPSTYSCGEPGKTCSAEEYQEFRRKQALVEEATAVYRRFFEEETRLIFAGGATEPTPVLRETTDGEFLETTMALLERFAATKTRFAGERRITSIQPWWDLPPGAVVGLRVCQDGRSTSWVAGDGQAGKGQMLQLTVALEDRGGRMKLVDGYGTDSGSCV